MVVRPCSTGDIAINAIALRASRALISQATALHLNNLRLAVTNSDKALAKTRVQTDAATVAEREAVTAKAAAVATERAIQKEHDLLVRAAIAEGKLLSRDFSL